MADQGSTSAKPRAVEEGPGWLSTAPAGGTALHTAARQSRGAGGRGKGPFSNFQNFQGPECKTRITFKLKLK